MADCCKTWCMLEGGNQPDASDYDTHSHSHTLTQCNYVSLVWKVAWN